MLRLGNLRALGALAALGLAFCHPTEQPPLPPPKPTNPTTVAARDPSGWVIDASIVSDGGGTLEAGFELDTGAGARRTASQ